MTAKSICIATLAALALGASPALAGENCHGAKHVSVPEVVADVNQSTPAEATTAIPYPLPTIEDENVVASVDADQDSTSTE